MFRGRIYAHGPRRNYCNIYLTPQLLFGYIYYTSNQENYLLNAAPVVRGAGQVDLWGGGRKALQVIFDEKE